MGLGEPEQVMPWSGRTAIVTGAASGIGRAVALRLCEAGATVVAVDRDSEGLRVLAEAGPTPRVCDVTSEDQRILLIESIETVDYLVNAAGTVRLTKLADLTEDIWDQTMAVNAKATLFLMQALAPRMVPGSAIVNLASAAGKTAHMIEQVDYSAAKAAVIAMTKSFALAFAGNGVRVNCVCPGMTDTPMHRSVRAGLSDLLGVPEAEIDEQRVASIPMARKASPEEVAAVVCFLLSEDASYMTGQAVNVTGGLVMH